MSIGKLKAAIVKKATCIKPVSILYTMYKIKQCNTCFLSDDEIKMAEANPDEKKRKVTEYFKRHPKRFLDDVAMVDNLLSNAPSLKNREDKEEIRTELLFYRIGYGFHPEEYVCYELENYSKEEKRRFLSSKECVSAALRMNDYHKKQILNNKGLTYDRFSMYYKRDAVYIEKPTDFSKFQDFIKNHSCFVKKNVYESMGRSVELINMSKMGISENVLFSRLIEIGPHLLEECVVQSSDMAMLNPSSVNTIRCITFNTREGIKDLFYFMKIGQGGSFVDNGSAGGILVGIDNDTGCLNTDGFDEVNRCYEKHPDTGIKFKGYQLPEWEKLKILCIELSSQLPAVKYIGWDLAHTSDGWVLIEGNGSSQMIGPQTVYKRGYKEEFELLMAQMDLCL